MMVTIIVFIFFFILIMIVSETKELTCARTIFFILKCIIDWIKSLIPQKECIYPTGIGYDVNGCFCPDAVEKEFYDLDEVLDSMYLENSTVYEHVYEYDFKYARIKNDITGIELYDYIDKKVISIVQRYLHRIGNNRAADTISSITINDTELTVFIARTSKGESLNSDWRKYQRNSYGDQIINKKKDRGPIDINWEEA